jgi:predicted acetyltransferase
MTTSETSPAVEVKVVPAARERETVLANMFELYSHDFSEFTDLRLGPDGRFGYGHLHLYWEEADRHPFVVEADGHLAGFVFVHRGSALSGDREVWDMAEFFVVRGFRGQGVGKRAAREVWERFPGRWEVRVMDSNRPAQRFWQRAVEEFVGRAVEPAPFEREGRGWHVLSFESARPPG